MGVIDFFRKGFTAKNPVSSSINESKTFIVGIDNKNTLRENLGIVDNGEFTFTSKLGVEQPFDGTITEGLYKHFGLTTAVIDKYVDFVVGGGVRVIVYRSEGVEDERATKELEAFIRETQFTTLLRHWVKEALIKPGGYIELGGPKGGEIKGLKILDGIYMYVNRDKKGVIEGYNQWVGGFDKFSKDKMISFKPYQIAALHFNIVGDCPYGLGIVSPTVKKIEQIINLERDMHTIVHRKANNSLHIKVGDPNNPETMPSQGDIDRLRNDAQVLTNKTEWITDAHTDISVIDSGNINDKFSFVLESDVRNLIASYQVPEVVLGFGNIPEGLAKVQAQVFERRIQSFQEEIEKVLEEQIFSRVLASKGFVGRVEVEWGTPSRGETNDEIDRIQRLLGLPMLNSGVRRKLEERLMLLFGFDDSVLSEDDSDVPEEEEESEAPSVLQDNFRLSVAEGVDDPLYTEFLFSEDPYSEDVSLAQWLGFKYETFRDDIKKVLESDDFGSLKAFNSLELEAGKLSDVQVSKLRNILVEGFEEGQSIRTIKNNIANDLSLKDALVIKNNQIELTKEGEQKIAVKAENRPLIIARTETVRVASKANEARYGRAGVREYVWRAAMDGRTCPTCEELDGTTYKIGENFYPPAHVACRCTMIPVIPERGGT